MAPGSVPQQFRLGLRPFWGSGDGQPKQLEGVGADADGKERNLEIRNTANLGLNFGKGVPAQIPASQIEFGGQLGLRHALLFAEAA